MFILDILEVINYIPVSNDELNPCGKIPVFSQSKNKLEGYTNSDKKTIVGPAIIFGDHTSEVNYTDGKFCVSVNCKVLKPKNKNIDLYFLYTYISFRIRKEYTSDYGRHFKLLKEMKAPDVNNINDKLIGCFFKV